MTELYRFLAVRDTEAATEFYAAAFGATVVQRFGPVRVLEIEGFHVGLAPEAPGARDAVARDGRRDDRSDLAPRRRSRRGCSADGRGRRDAALPGRGPGLRDAAGPRRPL
jgi:catechol 2,3-dioxygenase-like lactoylglutathione lyase family enzyme